MGLLQSSFIFGRGTPDNTYILQDFAHSMHCKKKACTYMVLKLDLEQTYYIVDFWILPEATLKAFGSIPCVNLSDPVFSLLVIECESISFSSN